MKITKFKTKTIATILVLSLCLVGLTFIMTACNNVTKSGEFYTLQEAYEQGFITKADLQNIAYFLNSSVAEAGFVPTPKNPAELSKQTEKQIKETRVYELQHDSHFPEPKASIKDVTIENYYGTYNSMVAVLLTDAYHMYMAAETDVEIDGVVFHYFCYNNKIVLWKSI